MYKIGENEMVLCPYNRSHVVSKLRIQKHIIKCQDRHPEVKLITCFYNYTHKLKPEDILNHYEICSQKMRIEEARYCENGEYNSCRSEVHDNSVYDSINNEKPRLFSTKKTNSVKSYNAEYSKFKSSASQNESGNNSGEDGDVDELRPLNLPKTQSKAFTKAKPQTDKSYHSISESASFPSVGLCRGRTFFFNPPKPRVNSHLQQDVKDLKNRSPKKIKSRSRCFLNNAPDIGNSCSTSVISSSFDDHNTLSSDILFYDDDESNDGFIFKDFDKYVKI